MPSQTQTPSLEPSLPEAPSTSPQPDDDRIAIADTRQLSLETGRRLVTRHAGLFLFLPLLAHMRFDQIVARAGYPGTPMVPAASAFLSLLTLKLLDKERLSHIDDFNCDEALGLFAGLNILPKKSFATDYSYRTTREQQVGLLQGWVGQLAPLLFPEANSFSLDFHAIGHRGEETDLENHYQPMRGQAGPSVLTCFAMEQTSRTFCYSDANLIRADQSRAVLQFIDFWKQLAGHNPQWLYFDSKFTTYAELSEIMQQDDISFVTIRRRGSAILRRLSALPSSSWKPAVIDIPKRRHKRVQYVDERVKLRGIDGDVRQLAVKGLGRENPTLFLSNNFAASPRDLVMNYARRNGVEDALGSSVNFFHLDCLSSEVRLNVDLDTVLTVLANGCYRWLASQLHGFTQSQPKALYRKFVECSGAVEIETDGRIVVSFDRRSHNPILREAGLDRDHPKIPWLANRRLEFVYS
ncbi:MAG: hypothetical protein O3B13_12675 [Planctomycetota bacterium]|nr:hypothetical protein [Planctomycetota bacterium]